MKILITILPILYLSFSDNSSADTKNGDREMLDLPTKDTFKLICEMPNIEELIVRSDTSYDYPNYKEHTIRSFDKKNRLIQVFKSFLSG